MYKFIYLNYRHCSSPIRKNRYGISQHSFSVSETLLHGGMDSLRQVTSAVSTVKSKLVKHDIPYPVPVICLTGTKATITVFKPDFTGAGKFWFQIGTVCKDTDTTKSSVVDPGCLSQIRIFSIPDPHFFHPESRIHIKEFRYFTQKMVSKLLEI